MPGSVHTFNQMEINIKVEAGLVDIEKKLQNFEHSLEYCLHSKLERFNNDTIITETFVNSALIRSESILNESIHRQRNLFLEKLKINLILNLEAIERNENAKTKMKIIFDLKTRSSYILNRLSSVLLGNLYSENDFSLINKLKYLNFFNSMMEIEKLSYTDKSSFRFGTVIRYKYNYMYYQGRSKLYFKYQSGLIWTYLDRY